MLSRPGGILCSSLPPTHQHLLTISAPGPDPIGARGSGQHRYTRTPRPATHSHGCTKTCRHPRERTAYTSPETHASIHVHTPFTHTSTRATPHGARRQRVEARREARCPHPGHHPYCNPGKPPANQPESVFTCPHRTPATPQLRLTSGDQGARGAFSLKAVCLGTCVNVGWAEGPCGRPWVLLMQLLTRANVPGTWLWGAGDSGQRVPRVQVVGRGSWLPQTGGAGT